MIKLIGLALIAAGQVLATNGETSNASTSEAPAGGEAPKRGRGRPPGGGGSSEPDKGSGVKTYEELRAIVQPLIEGGQGPDVKKVVAKYSASGLKDLKAEDQPAFLKDIDALTI